MLTSGCHTLVSGPGRWNSGLICTTHVCTRWCWPGSSSYLDVLSPEVCAWWATNFHPGGYPGATKHLYIWNDMNEPSVFNGPEVNHTCCCHLAQLAGLVVIITLTSCPRSSSSLSKCTHRLVDHGAHIAYGVGTMQITFPKDLVHHGNVEHRDVHNLYGKLYHEVCSSFMIMLRSAASATFSVELLFRQTMQTGLVSQDALALQHNHSC
jgi:alpha-glucosidase (family GH31 glycosyl hydrolase)